MHDNDGGGVVDGERVADVELVCLATWKMGSERYAFGYLIGPGFSIKRDAYRCLVSKGAITSKIKHAIKHKTSPATLARLLQPSLAFCFSLQPMTAYRPGLDGTPSLAAS